MIRQSRGFLLFEVLLTVVLVSVSVIFINHAFSSSLKVTSLVNRYHQAIILLDEKVFDIELNMCSGEIPSFSKEDIFSGTPFLWDQKTSPLEQGNAGDGYNIDSIALERLSCSISWESNGVRGIELYTYIPVTKGATR
jgi:hypothetical protein